MLTKLQNYLRSQFSLDLRAIGLARFLLGCVLMLDWSIRLDSFYAHYSLNGIIPVSLVLQNNWDTYYYSLFIYNDTFSLLLMCLALLFAFFMAIGYQSRLMLVFNWVLLTSIHNRNPYVLQGGDDLLRIALFWMIFLPSGARYSVDALHLAKKGIFKNLEGNAHFSVAGIGVILMVFSVYFFSALLKNSSEWHTKGNALYYALSLDQMLLPLGRVIYPYDLLLKGLTLTTYYFELIVPFLLLIPFKNHLFRSIAVFCILGFHLFIANTLFVGLFFTIGFSTAIWVLHTKTMDKLEERLIFPLKEWNPLRFLSQVTPSAIALLKKPNSNFYVQLGLGSFLSFIIIFCLLWNMSTVSYMPIKLSGRFKPFGNILRLNQSWGMFAPNVFKEDGWYLMEATMKKDSVLIDINRNGELLNTNKPTYILSFIKDDRWRKYQENYLFVANGFIRPYYCAYLMYNWNKAHPEKQIIDLKIIYMKELSSEKYITVKPSREVLFNCQNN